MYGRHAVNLRRSEVNRKKKTCVVVVSSLQRKRFIVIVISFCFSRVSPISLLQDYLIIETNDDLCAVHAV